MNWHPFFAQYRAFYIILAYQRHSTEIDSALTLLVVTGFLFLSAIYLVEMEMSYERFAMQLLDKSKTSYVHLRHYFSSEDVLNEQLLAQSHHLDTMVIYAIN